jgi:hypothetical protein
MQERPKSLQTRLNLSSEDSMRRTDGDCSPSWLAVLRFTSVEHLPVCPPHEDSVATRALPRLPVAVQADVGVLDCEA